MGTADSAFDVGTPRLAVHDPSASSSMMLLDPQNSSFDLIRALDNFLHEIGLLPLSEASSPDCFPESSGGIITHHRLCSDIPFVDICFLLNLVNVSITNFSRSVAPEEDQASRLLQLLSQLALLPAFTKHVGLHFAPVLPDLASRWLLQLQLQEDGTCPQEVRAHWPETESQDHVRNAMGNSLDENKMEAIKSDLRKIMSAFGILLRTNHSLFSFFVVFMRHPALANDALGILPSNTYVPIAQLEQPLPADHPLYQDQAVPRYLLTLSRVLSIAPHLPFPGLVTNGWILSPILLNILKHHPQRGTRQLAWTCWRFWIGSVGSSQLEKDARDRYVWQRATPTTSIEASFTAPWSPTAPTSLNNVHQDPSKAHLVSSLSDDMIIVDEQLTHKWELQISPTSPHESTVFYQVVSRVIDSWVLAIDEHQQRLNLERRSSTARFRSDSDLSPLFIEPHSLSSLVAYVEGNIVMKFSALPSPPTVKNPSRSSSQAALSRRDARPDSGKASGDRSFVNTASSSATLKSMALHLTARLPVLLTGPPSSGKNTIIQYLGALLWSPKPLDDQSSIKSVHLDQNLVILNLASRTLDAKSLIGSYVSSTEDPGRFVFVEGPLTRAMREGKWLVCQDIDRASDDVLSVINQVADLIKNRAEYEIGGGYGGHGGQHGVGLDLGVQFGWVPANERFQLLATRTCQDDQVKSFIGEQYWADVKIHSMWRRDFLNILTHHTPTFSDAVRDCLVAAWEEISSFKSDRGGRRCGQLDALLRWARRIQALMPLNQPLNSVSQNPVLQEQIFLEGVDLFLASSDTLPGNVDELKSDTELKIALALGSHLGLNPERSTYCISRRIPDYISPTDKSSSGAKGKSKAYAQIGRVKLPIDNSSLVPSLGYSRPFALTKSSLVLLERLAVCIRSSEPILLVGETGTGKTSIISFLAKLVGKTLVSLNLSNQSEASDLLGGFKPLDSSEDGKLHGNDLVDDFITTFGDAFSASRNQDFVQGMRKAALKKKYTRLVAMLKDAIRALTERLNKKLKIEQDTLDSNPEASQTPNKRRKTSNGHEQISDSNAVGLKTALQGFLDRVAQFEDEFVRSTSNQMRFRFVEGPLVKAIQRGDWVLLDEINLGTPETLESLSGLLRHSSASIILSERGDLTPIPRNQGFRLIGCMNPATDVGKRDLPPSMRSRFTELYVQPPDNDHEALLNIISQHLGGLCVSDKRAITDVADCYSTIRSLSRTGGLADGTNAPPHYSMRTLSRALTFATDVSQSLTLRRALVEGFLMAFVTTLDLKSTAIVTGLIDQHLVKNGKNPQAIMTQLPKNPGGGDGSFLQVGPFWLKKLKEVHHSAQNQGYVLTDSVKSKIIDLARAVTTGRYPVLIQGPTSSGKTSIVEYLARITGHSFVRINNHEHTDIQEYIGSYTTDADTGRLCFKEGALVRALRQGEWVVLDELNLAPSDVLEALNRLLDDNRELLIPETQEIVRPHPDFMLFATQNPPGLYGGRKVLSRAFRNRFLELHFGDVPKDELETILCQRCQIAPSYAKRIVQVFTELQRRRQTDRIFEQKHSFVTLRDLFRWGGRGAVGYQELAEDGYMLLAERSRGAEEKETVKQVLEEVMKVVIDPSRLYNDVVLPGTLVSTAASKRLFKLVSRALSFHEPVLLVGEAGSGKTSVCEALSSFANQRLRCINLHRNSEVGDLLGSQRPTRHRTENIQAALNELRSSLAPLGVQFPTSADGDIEEIAGLTERLLAERKETASGLESEAIELVQVALNGLRRSTALFSWSDGPLVQAMQEGDYVLLDEISLADDSVLERLNSLLEPERSIVLAERSGGPLDQMKITAHSEFEIMATMNPGGDFGKRELSPALRNRFTEIWVPLVSDPLDRLAIYSARLSRSFSNWAGRIISFSSFYSESPLSAQLSCRELSLRDGLAWCDFIRSCSTLPPGLAFIHGAQMTVLDRLGTAGFGQDLPMSAIYHLRDACLCELYKLAGIAFDQVRKPIQVLEHHGGALFGDFLLAKSNSNANTTTSLHYSFSAPTVAHNAMRIIRALQVPKAVLLEGSPGVGKTSMIEALARIAGKRLRRINLSDQTDLLDLFGADVPVENGKPGEFSWKDAAFLDALQNGDWVLLDEMNLAPQTVLEGLNACLDHRGSVYVPEIDRTFARHPDFKVFAAQNPHHQGGSRKGLPRSLVDRFTVVFMKEMEKEDLLQICADMSPGFDQHSISLMVNFNNQLIQEAAKDGSFARLGTPWEFNLRDLGRWLQLTTMAGDLDLQPLSPVEYLDMIYTGRFRTSNDQNTCVNISKQFFNTLSISRDHQDVVESPSELIVGHSKLNKSGLVALTPSTLSPTEIPPCLRNPAEALMRCLELKWLPILTGPERSGKTSLVKFLAARRGAQLRTISMHSGTDTSDLIGGFEQSSIERKVIGTIDIMCDMIQHYLQGRSLSRDLATSRLAITQRRLRTLKASASSECPKKTLAHTLEVVRNLHREENGLDFGNFEESLQTIQSGKSGCRFEWIDGPLVTAMKRGEWLLVDNANLCSASVLDRLNPLFEGTGTLQLSERGMHKGEIETILPHSDFRVIFVFNPRYGELSRAMRNRGVEIAFLPDPRFEARSPDRPSNSDRPYCSTFSTVNCSRNLTTADQCASALAVSDTVENNSVMCWTAQLLVHPPTEYPLLSRAVAHFLPIHHPDHMPKLICQRLTHPDLLEHFKAWAKSNRLLHFFVGEAFDLATAGQSDQDLTHQNKTIGHQALLSLVIAACLFEWSPSTPSLTTSKSVVESRSMAVDEDNHVDLQRVKIFVANASNAILELSSLILAQAIEEEASPRQMAEHQLLLECLQSLQAAVLQLTSLLQSCPDYAAVAFALKVVEESLSRVPSSYEAHFESTRISLTPLRLTHDISRWEALVHVWNLFCPQWVQNTELVHLSNELEHLANNCFHQMSAALRSVYFEVVASLRIGHDVNSQQSDITSVAVKLKEQMFLAKGETSDSSIAPLGYAEFGAVGEKLITVAVVMASFLDSKKHDTRLDSLLPRWRTLPSKIGVLFRSKAYLEEQKNPTDQVDLNLNLQILMLLTSSPAAISNCNRLLLEPLNLMSQLTGSAMLHSMANVTKLVETSTTLLHHGRVVETLGRHLGLLALTTPYLTVDREALCDSLISQLLDRMEAPLVNLDLRRLGIEHPAPCEETSKLDAVSRALRLWRLYIPDLPIDPLSVRTAHHAYLKSLLSRLRQLRDMLASHEQIKSGRSSNTRLRLLDEDIMVIERRRAELPQPSINRSPDTAILRAIFCELKAFEHQFLAEQQIDRFVVEIGVIKEQNDLHTLRARLETFSISAIGLFDRLSKRFPDFVDIIWPVQALVHVIIAKLTMKVQHASAAFFHSSIQPIGDFLATLTTGTSSIVAANLRRSPPATQTQQVIGQETSQSLIAILCISAVAKIPLNKLSNADSQSLISSYDTVWQLWSRDRIREQREAEEKAQEFKTRRQDISIVSDEEIEAEELRALFPIYGTEMIETTSVSSTLTVTSTQVDVLCNMHLAMTLGHSEETSPVLSFDSLRKQLVVAVVEKHGHMLPAYIDQCSLGFQIHSLSKLLISASSNSPSTPRKDFYNASNIIEATRVLPIVTGLSQRVKELIREWPELINLDEIRQRCEQIGALSSESPLARIIPFLETLIGQIEEWQKYSCSENSLLKYQNDLTTLVVSWRRVELGSWATLIEREIETFKASTNTWWFRLYELLVRGFSSHQYEPRSEEAKSYVRECAIVLNQFMSDCNQGQFRPRLLLLRSFSCLLKNYSADSGSNCWIKLNQLLSGVIYFYSHYEPQITEKIEQAKKAARGEIENYIRLASWKDVNIVALRQSSQKSHRQLYKCVRKFRSVLQGPVKDHLQGWKAKHPTSINMCLPPNLQHPPECLSVRIESSAWHEHLASRSMPAYFSQPGPVLRRLHNLVESKALVASIVEGAASEIESLSSHIYLAAKELSEEKIPKGDSKEGFARNLDLRKRKAFSDLLKQLRILGIGTTPNDRLLDRLSDPAVILSQPLLGPDSLPVMKESCDACDDYLFALLNEMPQFRRHRSQHHSDITKSDMQRLIGSVESGLALVMVERQVLSSLVITIKTMEPTLSRMTELLRLDNLRSSSLTGTGLLEVCRGIMQCQGLCASSIMETAEHIRELSDQQTCQAPASVIKTLDELRLLATENSSRVEDLITISQTHLTLLKPDEAEILENTIRNLSSIVDRLELLALEFPDLSFLLAPLSNALRSHQESIPKPAQEQGHDSDKAWAILKKLTDSVLIVIQELATKKGTEAENLTSKKNEGLLRKAHSAFNEFTAQCHLEEVLKDLRCFNEVLSVLNAANGIPSMLSMAASFIQNYLRLIYEHLMGYLRWHQGTIKLLQTVVTIGGTIAEQGFCKPDFSEDKDDTSGNDGPSTDGTGLGGGQGAKDVGDEIESEEQLEGLQGEVEEEDRADKEPSKEDKAVETQTDFEAPLEDIQEAEGDDADSKMDDEEGSDQDVEDGVGKVDPLDTGAVDEKFWEGDGEDEDQLEPDQPDLSAKENKSMPQDSDLASKDNTTGGEQTKHEESEDRDAPTSQEKVESDADGSLPDLEADGDEPELEEDHPETQGNEENAEPQVPNDTVPMMDHIDNSAALDLPEDMELTEPQSEQGDLSDDDSIMELDETDPQQPENQPDAENEKEEESRFNDGLDGPQPDSDAQEIQPSNDSSGPAQDGGTGAGGGGTSSLAAALDPPDNPSQDLPEAGSGELSQPVQHRMEGSADSCDAQNEPTQTAAPQQVGNGDVNGEPASQALESGADSPDKGQEFPKPNPLRDLGDAMKDWKRRLQQIMDAALEDQVNSSGEQIGDAAEVEYLQAGHTDATDQQAPGPATEDQACSGLDKMQIDDDVSDCDIPQPSMSNLLPPPAEHFHDPEPARQSGPVEAAIAARGNEKQSAADDPTFEGFPPEDVPADLEDEDVAHTMDLVSGDSIQSGASPAEIWRQYQQLTQRPASQLTEHLRLILEPTTATRLQGDYRTGKRLNMRKLVSYLASDYTKDRIWLRRTKPAQRDYKILVAVDDSRSMADSRCAHLAFQTLALVTSALSKLEVGEVAIAKFGSVFEVLRHFGGAHARSTQDSNPVEGFTFAQQQTNVRLVVERALGLFAEARVQCSNVADDAWQLAIIVSDGVCQDHDEVRALLRKAIEQRVLFVFLILDSLHQHGGEGEGDANASSIISMNSVSYVSGQDGQLELRMERYLDSFPFDYYIILRDVEALPHVLSATLRQFFERVSL